jgi:hypothetical protein
MSTILDTVVDYETKVVDLVASAKDPVVAYVRKGVEAAEGRLPELPYPEALPTPFEVVDSQVAFAKSLLDAQADLVTAVLATIAPVAGYKAPPKKAAKAARSTKAA